MFFPSEVNVGQKNIITEEKMKMTEERHRRGWISTLLRAKGQVIKQEKHVMDFSS